MLMRWSYVWLREKRMKRFLAEAPRSRQVQREVLFRKLRRNADSRFGREHGFSQIRSVRDFRRQVPVMTYEDYRPYVEQVKRGQIDALFGPGTKLLMFAMTSGTTDKPKYIPVTQDFFDECRIGWNLWGVHAYADHLDLCRKQTMQLSSDWQESFTEGGIPCGNISGLAAETAPAMSRPMFVLPRWLNKIRDPISKRYAALRVAIASRRVGMIVTANPNTLVGLAKLAEVHRESLLRDLHDGTFSSRFEMPDEIRRRLRRTVARPRRRRARQLQGIVERTGHLYPRDFWPELSVLAVWTGGAMAAYLPQVKEYFGDKVFRDHGLSASEGRMTLPLEDNTSAGILEFNAHYFEFIPEEGHGSRDPLVLEASELEVGRNYYLVLTTSSGLYRYDIHDMVRCVGFLGTAPVLEFLNKGTHFSNIAGEKLSEFQVVSAVKSGFSELSIGLDTFTVAPLFGEPAGYVLLTEQELAPSTRRQLAQRIDAHLARLNCEYAERLQSRRLRPLSMERVPAGTWAEIERERTCHHANMEQYKHPCLVGDLRFVERVLNGRQPASRGKALLTR